MSRYLGDAMPQQVRMPRYISQRNSAGWDDIIRRVIDAGAWEQEQIYFGITTEDRAQEVFRKLRTAASHHGAGRKVFWFGCNGCKDGGKDCRFHVSFTLYPLDKARAYKQQHGPRPGNSAR